MTDSSNFVLKRIGTYDLTGNRLGKGNFAYVELATNRITKTKVAIKVIDTRKINDEYVRKNILREALLLKKVNHPNIVRLYETLRQHSVYCIVTEYVPGGELLSYLRRQNDSKLSESQARPIMRQLISALHHMHQNGVVHRDLKMENILLDESKKNIKIVDFGLSNICLGDDLLKTQCGSPEYAAPELFRRGCRYGTEVDLWSLGVIMYGVVVGRLPFRSPHYGSRGRSDLLDQTSRGLSNIHNKYLVLLTPHCRDLLRKLLEPNPQMRLPLLDCMVHPWVTVQGTVPLVPFNEQLYDEQLWDKVLEKTSQLINIGKSKIAYHIQQKRYDAISGVYNLLLDKELKRLSRSDGDSSRMEATDAQEGSIIRVSIKTTSSDGKEHSAQGPESESATSNDSHDSSTEQDWEQAPTRKHIVSKPNEPQSKTIEQPLGGLRIRGLRIRCRAAPPSKKQPQEQPHARTRPNTANAPRAPEITPPTPQRSAVASRAWQRAGKTRCKSCFPRFAPSFDSELHGTQVVMSPRARQDPVLLASQWEAKMRVLASEGGEGSVGYSEQGVNTGIDTEGDNCKKSATVVDADVPISKSEATLDQEPNMGNWKSLESTTARNCTSSGTSEVKQTSESNKPEGNKTSQTLQENQKSVPSRGSVRSYKTGAKISPSSLAAQSVHRAVSPLKTSQFVDLADYSKYVPQPPKSRTATLGGPSRLAIKTEREVDSFSAAYQSFVKTKKPQHVRLSIMQAQEILQHESKFHAKYGRRLSTDVRASNVSNTDSDKQTENQASRCSHASTETSPNAVQKRATVQQLSIAKPGQVRGVGLKRDQRETIVYDAKWEDNIEKQDYTSHDQPLPPYLSVAQNSPDNPTDADHDGVESEQKGRSCINEENRAIEARLKSKQEESLKRQKEKEQTEGHERERVKFLKELEDKERQKIITEYLQHVYSHHDQTPPQSANKKSEHDTRSHKVSRQGRVYSTVTRPQKEHNPDVPHLITSPAPIWPHTTRGSQGDKKISFRANQNKNQGVTGTNGVRFFKEWNNSLFTNYINSSDGDAEMGKEKDNLQNPSYWMEQHLEGVLDKTSVRTGQQHHQQIIPRET